jgi:hypothetical protein
MLHVRIASALFLTAALAACDRGPDESSKDASTYTRNGPQADTQSRPAAPAGSGEAPAPRATLAPVSPQRDTLTDTVITGKIKAAILTDPGMTGADVSVNTDRGVVALAGSVKSQEQIAIASAHAQRQDGVLRVDNHLAMNAQ